MRILLSITIYAAVLAASAAGGVVSIGAGAFPGTATLITFEGASGQITNQYAGQGVTVTGGMLYATGNYSPYFGSPTDAENFAPSSCPCPFVTLSFSTPIVQIGFDAAMNAGATLTVSDSNGSLGYPGPTDATEEFFVGFQDSAGFTSVTFGYPAVGAFTGGFAIDNLEFDGTTTSSSGVPEPATVYMAGIALALLIVARLRKAPVRSAR